MSYMYTKEKKLVTSTNSIKHFYIPPHMHACLYIFLLIIQVFFYFLMVFDHLNTTDQFLCYSFYF